MALANGASPKLVRGLLPLEILVVETGEVVVLDGDCDGEEDLGVLCLDDCAELEDVGDVGGILIWPGE